MCLYPVKIPDPRAREDMTDTVYPPIVVSCGKCVECLQQHANEWAHRIVDECKQHEQNCFITLTYNDDYKPLNGSLVKRDLQLFLKRLRKHLEPVKIRVFYCGEYGKKHLRPHYHVIVFGWKPDDLFFWQKDGKDILYRSPQLEKLWKFGFSSVGDVTINSARYCAKYMQKLQKIPDGLVKPFTGMSLKPGIGYNAISAECLTGDRIYHSGKSVKVPRYYLKVLEREGHDLTAFKERRQIVGAMRERATDLVARRKKAYEFRKKR